MTRTKPSSKMSKRKTNPLYRRRQGIGRPKIGFNGQELYSVAFVDHSLGAGNLVTDWHQVDCNSGEGINRAGIDVIKHYQEYKYLSAGIEWIPKVGPAGAEAGSRINIAYMDNPELMNVFENAAPATRVAMIKAAATCKTYNVWERFVYQVPLTFRRKMFNVDPTVPAVGARSNEEFERATQGKVAICIETVAAAPAAGTLGQWRMTSNTYITGFTATIVT